MHATWGNWTNRTTAAIEMKQKKEKMEVRFISYKTPYLFFNVIAFNFDASLPTRDKFFSLCLLLIKKANCCLDLKRTPSSTLLNILRRNGNSKGAKSGLESKCGTISDRVAWISLTTSKLCQKWFLDFVQRTCRHLEYL